MCVSYPGNYRAHGAHGRQSWLSGYEVTNHKLAVAGQVAFPGFFVTRGGSLRVAETLIENWVPGIRTVRTYQRDWFPNDLIAGISVAAVAIPIGIAYASLAGLPPAIGIYSCVLPPVAYALFGSSRQLIVNPDAAACVIVAATVAPIAGSDPSRYEDLSILLTIIVGVLCIAAGIARLGAIANFLSRPILVGYLNGIALSIIAGQLGKILGIKIASAGFFRTIGRVAMNLGQTHWPTLAVGLTLLILLRVLKRISP